MGVDAGTLCRVISARPKKQACPRTKLCHTRNAWPRKRGHGTRGIGLFGRVSRMTAGYRRTRRAWSCVRTSSIMAFRSIGFVR